MSKVAATVCQIAGLFARGEWQFAVAANTGSIVN